MQNNILAINLHKFHLFIYLIYTSFFWLHFIFNLSYCEEGIRIQHDYSKWCLSDRYFNHVWFISYNHWFDSFHWFLFLQEQGMEKNTQQTRKGNQKSPWTCRLRIVVYVERSLQIPLLEITSSTLHTIKCPHTLAKLLARWQYRWGRTLFKSSIDFHTHIASAHQDTGYENAFVSW